MIRCFGECEKLASEIDLEDVSSEVKDFVHCLLETLRKARIGLPFKIITSFQVVQPVTTNDVGFDTASLGYIIKMIILPLFAI
jgi:hypothetical protein